METVLLILILLASLAIILATLLMEPKQEGMGSITGTSSSFGTVASNSKEKLLRNISIGSAIIVAISIIILAVIK